MENELLLQLQVDPLLFSSEVPAVMPGARGKCSLVFTLWARCRMLSLKTAVYTAKLHLMLCFYLLLS